MQPKKIYLIPCIWFQDKEWICYHYPFHYKCYAHIISYTRICAVSSYPRLLNLKQRLSTLWSHPSFYWGYPHLRFTSSHELTIWLRENRDHENRAECKNSHHYAMWLRGPAIKRWSPFLSSFNLGRTCALLGSIERSNRNHSGALPRVRVKRPCYF